MGTNLEDSIELIEQNLLDEARDGLRETRNVSSGSPLLDSVEAFQNSSGDFVVEFLDYGVFLDQGTQYIDARPFYSDLADTQQDEVSAILEDAFNQDIEELDNEIDE